MGGKLTLRDRLALEAMATIISKIPLTKGDEWDVWQHSLMVARGAYSYADAMLKAREE